MAKIEVKMPKMGESITEGTVITWYKKTGESVELDEPLLEIGTDKVDTEVPSPAAGTLHEILVPEGETVEVGVTIAVLETSVEAAVAAPAPPVDEAPEAKEAIAAEEIAPAPEKEEDVEAPAAPPVEAGPDATPSDGFSIITRPNGTSQWASAAVLSGNRYVDGDVDSGGAA